MGGILLGFGIVVEDKPSELSCRLNTLNVTVKQLVMKQHQSGKNSEYIDLMAQGPGTPHTGGFQLPCVDQMCAFDIEGLDNFVPDAA